MFGFVFWFLVTAFNPDTTAPDYAWTEMGANNRQIVRVITREKTCPTIQVNGKPHPLTPRGENPPPNFDVLVCECDLPQNTQTVGFQGKPLPVVKRKPRRIAIIGDTGCRILNIEGIVDVQNCNGVKGYGTPWPFAQVADAVAAGKPDLIIHLGDYHYREFPCPEGNKGCAGPYGNNWPAWEADFFAPARNLLAAAPWVFIRGNHESCSRAWRGWFYLLDPGPLPANPWQSDQCPMISPAYGLSFTDLHLLVQDSANVPHSPGNDPKGKALVGQYAASYTRLNSLASADRENWLLTHEPIWGIQPGKTEQGTELFPLQLTLQAALKQTAAGAFSPHIGLLLSGHVHLFEALNFTDGRPPMMIIGNSGTKRSPAITPEVLAQSNILKTLGVTPENFHTEDAFNYAMAEATPAGWQVTLYQLDGSISQSFLVKNKQLQPKSPPKK